MTPARKLYLDNIRWMTVVLVVIYHVVYMFNGVQPFGVIGPFRERQLQDCFQYLVYPWFMALLFVVSGMSARYYLQSHTTKQFLKDKTHKLLVPSTIGLFVFQWLLGIYNLKIGGGLNIAGLPMPIVYLITVLSGVGPLWYIQMLWLFSILLLVVRKIEKRPGLELLFQSTGLEYSDVDDHCLWFGTGAEHPVRHRLSVRYLWILLLCRLFSVFPRRSNGTAVQVVVDV